MPDIMILNEIYHVNTMVHRVAKALFADNLQATLDEFGMAAQDAGLAGDDLLNFVIRKIVDEADANPKNAGWRAGII